MSLNLYPISLNLKKFLSWIRNRILVLFLKSKHPLLETPVSKFLIVCIYFTNNTYIHFLNTTTTFGFARKAPNNHRIIDISRDSNVTRNCQTATTCDFIKRVLTLLQLSELYRRLCLDGGAYHCSSRFTSSQENEELLFKQQRILFPGHFKQVINFWNLVK